MIKMQYGNQMFLCYCSPDRYQTSFIGGEISFDATVIAVLLLFSVVVLVVAAYALHHFTAKQGQKQQQQQREARLQQQERRQQQLVHQYGSLYTDINTSEIQLQQDCLSVESGPPANVSILLRSYIQFSPVTLILTR